MSRQKDILLIFISVACVIININGAGSIFSSIILVFFSFFFIAKPAMLIPMMFAVSWGGRFSVFGLGTFYYFFIILCISILINRQKFGTYIGLQGNMRSYLFLAIWMTYTSVTSVSHEYAFGLKYAITILILLVVSCFHIRDKQCCHSSIVAIAAIASVYFCCVAMFDPILFVSDNPNRPDLTCLTIMEGVNRNTASPVVVMLSIILLSELVRKRQLLLLFPLLMNMYTLMFLGSRTSFLTMLMILGLYILYFSQLSIKKKIGIIAFSIVAGFAYASILNGMDSHLTDSVIEDQGSGRFVTWALFASDVIPNYWLKGIGVGLANYETLGYIYDADDLYFDLLIQMGIIGFILFFAIFFDAVIRTARFVKQLRQYDYLLLMLLSFFILGIGESIFDAPLFWGVLLYVNSIVDIDLNKKSYKRI